MSPEIYSFSALALLSFLPCAFTKKGVVAKGLDMYYHQAWKLGEHNFALLHTHQNNLQDQFIDLLAELSPFPFKCWVKLEGLIYIHMLYTDQLAAFIKRNSNVLQLDCLSVSTKTKYIYQFSLEEKLENILIISESLAELDLRVLFDWILKGNKTLDIG